MSVKYAKFDSFLKRILPNKEYKEVRTYEPCVVTSSKDKHAFRFTFLTNHRIYITENPPKTLLYSVHLKDVVDVYMVNDKANFLQADLRDRVQHVIVTYLSVSDDASPLRVDTANNFTVPSRQQSSFPLEDVSPPLLCSYADVSTIESSRHDPPNSGPSGNKAEEPMSSTLWGFLKHATHRKSKSKLSKVDGVSRWEQKDPYPIHVELPETRDGQRYSTEELDLYILDSSTTFLPVLKSLWRNFIIYHGSTQRQNSKDDNNVNSTLCLHITDRITCEKSAAMDEGTKTLFGDLKQELIHARSIEQLYSLFNELKTAASQDILIKFLFWRDDILLRKSLDLIRRYVKDSVAVDIGDRADEIELTILVTQTLALMLGEAEAISQCYRVLQNFNLSFLTDTVNSLLSSPRLLFESWSYNSDIKSLRMEFTVAVCEILYQLIICAQQISWVISGKSSVFNSNCLFMTLDRDENLRSFLDRLVRACINMWDPPEKRSTKNGGNINAGVIPFNSADAVKAFFLFTVFHRTITHCPVAAQHVKLSYQEEFKYYISPGSVPVKFPLEYPISGMAKSAVHAVGYFITGMTAHAK